MIVYAVERQAPEIESNSNFLVTRGSGGRGKCRKNLAANKINRLLNASSCEMVHSQECINPRGTRSFCTVLVTAARWKKKRNETGNDSS